MIVGFYRNQKWFFHEKLNEPRVRTSNPLSSSSRLSRWLRLSMTRVNWCNLFVAWERAKSSSIDRVSGWEFGFYEKTKFNEFESLKMFKDFSYFPSSRHIHFMMIIYLIFLYCCWVGGVLRSEWFFHSTIVFECPVYHTISSFKDEMLSTRACENFL